MTILLDDSYNKEKKTKEPEQPTVNEDVLSTVCKLKTSIVAFYDFMGWKYTNDQLHFLQNVTQHSTLMCHRQWGKSETAARNSLYYAYVHGMTTLIVAQTDDKSKELYRKIRKLAEHPYIAPYIVKNTEHAMDFKNGARIRCGSAKNPDSLRGFTSDIVILDECAFYEHDQDVFDVIVFMTATRPNARIMLLSTPGFESGMFYDKVTEGLPENRETNGSKFTTFIYPWGGHGSNTETDGYGSKFTGPNTDPETEDWLITPSKAEEMATMFGGWNSPQCQREMLCKFASLDDMYFNKEAIENLFANDYRYITEAEPGKHYFMACDLAKSNDYTVMLVGRYETENVFRIVYMERFRHKNYDEMSARIHRCATIFNINAVAIDATGVGAALCDSFRNKYTDVILHEYHFTADSKSTWLSNLLTAMQRDIIKCPDDDIIRGELQTFIFKVNPDTKRIKLQAYGNLHDDTVVTLAMLVQECKLITRSRPVLFAQSGDIDVTERDMNYLNRFDYIGTSDGFNELPFNRMNKRRMF